MNMRYPHRQSGIVLFVALVVLVIMSLVGISMIRQMTSTQVVAGNLAFKEGAVAISDWGVESAREVITISTFNQSGAIDLTINSPAVGYYAAAPWEFGEPGAVPFDMFNADNWQDANSNRVVAAAAGNLQNEVRYVVHRLCRRTGPLDTNQCSLRLTTDGQDKGTDTYNDPKPPLTQQPYYRVTTRVVGPRNTISYTQVILY